MNESMETCEAKATRKIQNEPARHFSDDKQTATARRKHQAPHVPRLCSVVIASLGCIHILGVPPFAMTLIRRHQSQLKSTRCDATRVKPSHSSFEMPATCAVVTASRPAATPPNRHSAYAHTQRKGERERGSHWPNWLRDREFLTENRSTFIFCLFDIFATFLLTVLMGEGRMKGGLTSWLAVAPHQILILKIASRRLSL